MATSKSNISSKITIAIISLIFLVATLGYLYLPSDKSTLNSADYITNGQSPKQPTSQRVISIVKFNDSPRPKSGIVMPGTPSGPQPISIGKTSSTRPRVQSTALNFTNTTKAVVDPLKQTQRETFTPSTFTLSESGKSLLTTPAPPPSELDRLSEEKHADEKNEVPKIEISGAFENGTPVVYDQLSSNHIVIKASDRRLTFRLSNVRGKIIRIDIARKVGSEEIGGRTNPLYSYTSDLGAINPEISTTETPKRAWNGPSLPDTSQQDWHFIADVWNSESGTISMVQRFSEDSVYIAMRVPRTPRRNVQFFETLAAKPNVKAVLAGTSSDGRPLQIARIAEGSEEEIKSKPSVLIYAGEHQDEPDGMWAAEGAIEFLTQESLESKTILKTVVFYVIPCVDPDGTANSMHTGFTNAFKPTSASSEANAYAHYFQKLVDDGYRLDVALNLHNGSFKKPADLACAVIEGYGSRGKIAEGLHSFIAQHVNAKGYVAQERPWLRGWMPFRLGGWLTRRFGTFSMSYELDSQQATRHLNLLQLRELGKILVTSVSDFLSRDVKNSPMLKSVDEERKVRSQRLNSFRKIGAGENVLVYEAALAASDPTDAALAKREKFIP